MGSGTEKLLSSNRAEKKDNASRNTLVLLPTYNETETLPYTISALVSLDSDFDIMIIDDNSPDGTGELADKLANEYGNIIVLHRDKKTGLGDAYIEGFQKGMQMHYDYFVQMDVDGSHRPEDLEKILQYKEKSDLIIGSRWTKGGKVENWSKARELISRLGNIYASLMLGGEVKDMTAGFRVYSRRLLTRLPLPSMQAKGYGFQIEMTYRTQQLGVRPLEVPIKFVERFSGMSKMSKDIVIEALALCTKWGVKRFFKLK